MSEKDKFILYEKVRKSGVTNMFDFKVVSSLTGLTANDIIFVMKNYSELKEKYNEEVN